MRKHWWQYLANFVVIHTRDLFTEEVVKNRLQARYSMYCINKNISTQVMVKRKLALYKIQKRAGRMTNIDSLLIKPVQRLLK